MSTISERIDEELIQLDLQQGRITAQRELLFRLRDETSKPKKTRTYTKRKKLVPQIHKADLPTPQKGKFTQDELLEVLESFGKSGALCGELTTAINIRRPKDKVKSGSVSSMLRYIASSAKTSEHLIRKRVKGAGKLTYRNFYRA